MERSGKEPVICDSPINKLTYTDGRRRLEGDHLIRVLRAKAPEHHLLHTTKLPERIFLAVYPPTWSAEGFFNLEVPEGWVAKYMHYGREGMDFLKQLGQLHGGLGVPRVPVYYLVVAGTGFYQKFSTPEEARDWALRNPSLRENLSGDETASGGTRARRLNGIGPL